ncbi:MAG TPA: prolyl oligopeptidase family serine peptidase [Urbifossiella sp.]|jgi:dipeptidyl aminopeptidase/acylaminoacyl peptidase|nr:prolyl oligopeptidase family serine peptidase [Urbifossiella sp.]
MCARLGPLLVPILLAVTVARPLPAADPPSLPRYVPTPADLKEADRRASQPPTGGRVYREKVTPNWFAGGTKFWYRNDLKAGTKEFILVDAVAGTREKAFDHAKLAAGLSKAAGKDFTADRLPFTTITLADDLSRVRFQAEKSGWACDLATYSCAKDDAPAVEEPAAESGDEPTALAYDPLWPDGPVIASDPLAVSTQPPPPRKGFDNRSPDKNWTAAVREFNVVLRDADGKETRLTTDGKEGSAYGMVSWAPDSKALVAWRIEPGEKKEVSFVESSPKAGGRAVLHTRPYALPGDRFTKYEPHLFDPATGKEVKTNALPNDFGRADVRWAKDGKTFTYEKVDRGHQRFRLITVNARTGDSRTLIDESSDTFIWTQHFDGMNFAPVTWLQKTNEIVYATEKSGWRHLYLLDGATGAEKNAITSGEYVIRGIDHIDENARQIWFRACGKNADEDPYHIHHYRVNFDGTGLVALTAGDGTHTVQFSPDRRFVIDTYSRVNAPPITELRRASDGVLACRLEAADATEVGSGGLPEVFHAKGRDGKTDIWGLICRPRNFDPKKSYPVIEYIYAGPHGSHVPKAYRAFPWFRALTDLGFVVVQIDGMGTANRSKAFHDVCWKNIKDAGFPDRVLWHRAVAARYPWYDATRVGIYGTSAGGQNALSALLFHGDFYSAAMAACGCHDNRMDKASWNEQWMGYPVGPHYAACSNVDNANRLRGRLLLIVGEMDTNVPPESTFRVADALVKAGKDFDLLVVPGMGHSDGGNYGRRRTQDFFVRHLHGVEPPDRNRTALPGR